MGKSGNFCPGLRLALTLKRVAIRPFFDDFEKSLVIDGVHCPLRELQTNRNTNVFSRKTRTLRNQLSVGSVNSNRADFEPDSKVPIVDTFRTFCLASQVREALDQLR